MPTPQEVDATTSTTTGTVTPNGSTTGDAIDTSGGEIEPVEPE